MLENRAAALDAERKLRNENKQLMSVGPVVEIKFTKLKDDGIIVSAAFPDSLYPKMIVQLSSPLPGSINILFREPGKGLRAKVHKAHYQIYMTLAMLLDCTKTNKHILEMGKVKFNVDNFLTFVNERLHW
eukprot:c21637_g2_i1.p1 GENE.c21637_g2_i1~~c21637_g2_i1.p1  ORF type:complete len:130 (-),score=23.20 c21637_g2_i1:77-466(-)